jgi:hypothetical protein
MNGENTAISTIKTSTILGILFGMAFSDWCKRRSLTMQLLAWSSGDWATIALTLFKGEFWQSFAHPLR